MIARLDGHNTLGLAIGLGLFTGLAAQRVWIGLAAAAAVVLAVKAGQTFYVRGKE